ncbi:dihydrofolate reductase [Roseburia hominis]
MKLIVAVDKNWAIGKNNRMMWSIPADMKFFRETTKGNIVIMGRKTLESFPQGQPLKNRVNIVITQNQDYKVKDAIVVHSVEEALKESQKHEGEAFVIGGESIYRAMLPYCDTALVTKIDYAYEADTWFPNLDEEEDWEMTEEGEEQTCFDLEFAFTKYERIKK